VARTQIKVKIVNHSFTEYQNKPGIYDKTGKTLSKNGIGSHPPRNNKTNRFDITITCKYSPKKRKAKVIEEYSTLKPETNSDSASAKSKGARYVSAKVQINHIIARGPTNNINQTSKISCWANTTSVIFKLPTNKKICNKITEITNS